MKKIAFLFLGLSLMFRVVSGEETIVPLPELEKPVSMILDGELLVVEDMMSIKIFDAKDFHFIKKAGREGQGPGEFQAEAMPQFHGSRILVSSENKISWFTRTGDLVVEKRHPYLTNVIAAGSGFIGYQAIMDDPKDFFLTYVLFDSNFIPVKELHRGPWILHKNKHWDVLEIFFYDVLGDKIVFAHREGFGVDICDLSGNLLHSIHGDKCSDPPLVTGEDKKDMILYLKRKGFSEDKIKSRADFLDRFPSIMTCRLADNKIYVVTYSQIKGKYECLIYDLNGAFVGKTFLPLVLDDPGIPLPFAIHAGRLYRLLFDETENVWKLHVNPLD